MIFRVQALLQQWFDAKFLIFTVESDQNHHQIECGPFALPLIGPHGVFVDEFKSQSLSMRLVLVPSDSAYSTSNGSNAEVFVALNDSNAEWMLLSKTRRRKHFEAGDVVHQPQGFRFRAITRKSPME